MGDLVGDCPVGGVAEGGEDGDPAVGDGVGHDGGVPRSQVAARSSASGDDDGVDPFGLQVGEGLGDRRGSGGAAHGGGGFHDGDGDRRAGQDAENVSPSGRGCCAEQTETPDGDRRGKEPLGSSLAGALEFGKERLAA